jgi:hypothetical protein
MSIEVPLIVDVWKQLSSTACTYQLQHGKKAYVLVSTTQPNASETGLAITVDVIYSFTPTSDNILWVKAYNNLAPYGMIKVTAPFSTSIIDGGTF